jgi:hypothetical protein
MPVSSFTSRTAVLATNGVVINGIKTLLNYNKEVFAHQCLQHDQTGLQETSID